MIRGNDEEEEKGRDLPGFDEAVFMTHGKLLYSVSTVLTIQTFNLIFFWDQLGRDFVMKVKVEMKSPFDMV